MLNPHADLFSRDVLLAELVANSTPILENKINRSIYNALLSSIISQQLSVRAAATIKARLWALFPDNNPLPELLLQSSPEQLKAVGISGQKCGYLKSVAMHKIDGFLEDGDLIHLPDEEIIVRLTQIKGIGRWTAEMILISTLYRPDVMPVDDLGIYNAMKRLYGFVEPHKAAKQIMSDLSEKWRPHRTLACRYLWQSLNNTPA